MFKLCAERVPHLTKRHPSAMGIRGFWTLVTPHVLGDELLGFRFQNTVIESAWLESLDEAIGSVNIYVDITSMAF